MHAKGAGVGGEPPGTVKPSADLPSWLCWGRRRLLPGFVGEGHGCDLVAHPLPSQGSWCSHVVSLRPGKPRPLAIVALANDLERSFRCLAILHPIMEQPYDLFWAKLLTSFLLQDEW